MQRDVRYITITDIKDLDEGLLKPNYSVTLLNLTITENEKLIIRKLITYNTKALLTFDKCSFECIFDYFLTVGRKVYRQISFVNSIFIKQIFFKDIIFLETSNFTNVTFDKLVNFENATFKRKSDFTGATFNQYAHFRSSLFNEVDFIGAKFNNDAHFDYTMFSSEALFNDATFCKEANFNHTYISVRANFTNAKFNQLADFSEAKLITKLDLNGISAMTLNISTSTICELNLFDSKIDNIYLDNLKYTFKYKKRVYEDKTEYYSEISYYTRLKDTFRQLKILLNNNKNYTEENRIYALEYEAQYRYLKEKKVNFFNGERFTLFIFKWSSKFFQSIWLPLIWLIIIIFLFEGYVTLWNFNFNIVNNSTFLHRALNRVIVFNSSSSILLKPFVVYFIFHFIVAIKRKIKK